MTIACKWASAAFCLSALGCYGQTAATAPLAVTAAHTASFTVQTVGLSRMMVFTGAPYCADEIAETVRLLPDNVRISSPGMETYVCRDSQGRMRRDTPMRSSAGQLVTAQIQDPVAGFAYVLDAQSKIAHRVALQPIGTRRPGTTPRRVAEARTTVNEQGVETRIEPLGDQLIEGIVATGTRISVKYPPGARGNEREMVTVNETWTSPELQTTMRFTMTGSGVDSTMKLTNVTRSEPDSTLFQPPADYRIVDETEPTISIQYALP